MPYINIKLTGTALLPRQREGLLARITDLMGTVMKKRREVTVVSLEEADPTHWAVGGRALNAADHAAAYVEIKVTAGTNTPEEKAAMVAETVAALKSVVGEVQTATYIVIHDIAADSWGYDGVTQAARRKSMS
jgi:4-oxalocrotonate tautomerase